MKQAPAPFRVYLLTNRVTGEKYVGATKHPLAVRWQKHRGRAFSKIAARWANDLSTAIRKYGPEAFDRCVLSEALNETVAYKLECFWIRELDTLTPHGYNMRSGGKVNFRWSRKTLLKLRNTQIARMRKPENIKRLKEAKTPNQRRVSEKKGRQRAIWKKILAGAIYVCYPY
ncbi:MAG TPA: GIY-YIG nuclease family protein [Candidatus Sulfotelmatobacter sp.]